MSTTRIYLVNVGNDENLSSYHLVEATSPSQAIRHVSRDMFSVKVASGKETATFMKAGLGVEMACSWEKTDQADAPTQDETQEELQEAAHQDELQEATQGVQA